MSSRLSHSQAMQDRPKSRLELSFSRSRLRASRALRRAKQSPAPSTSVKDVINIEDSPEKSNDDLVLHQLEKSLVPSWSFDEVFGTQEWPEATEGNVGVQQPSWSQDWLQRESSSSTSNLFGDFSFGGDLPLSTELFANIQEDNNNHVLQPTEQFLAPSTSVQDSLGEFQDWAATASSIFREMLDQPEQSLAQSAMARHDRNQDLLLEREPSSTSNTFGGDLPLSTELFSNTQSFGYASTTQEQRINDQDLPVSQVVQTQKPTRNKYKRSNVRMYVDKQNCRAH
ncbi:hypothetical protein Bca52824_001994 [Brassica carinata]|uniref:Uncharacterized protein n=1 Tax=Brassica carinata TaxID=52824 RepID=A0A8X7WJC6_BRACI|nr:hypothetical protein Bca52824_001994 [Brassica carinata]